MKGTISIFCLILIVLPVAIAQSTIILEPEVDAGITPESIFYQIDVWLDEQKIFRTQTDPEKARLRLEIAEERVAELKLMIQKSKAKESERAKEEQEKQIRELEILEKKLTEEQKIKIQERLQKHILVLTRVKERAPEQAQKGLERAIENANKTFERIQELISIETRQSIEDIREKIEKGQIIITDPIEFKCNLDADCPQILCIRAPCPGYKCVENECVLSKCGNLICDEQETLNNCPQDCLIACPAVCRPLWNLESGGCTFRECGSGCGPDHKTTFDTEEECKHKLDEINKPCLLTVCSEVWVLRDDKTCIFNSCGSGCGPDGIRTFQTEVECKQRIRTTPVGKEISISIPSSFSLSKEGTAEIINFRNTRITLLKIVPDAHAVVITVSIPGGCGLNSDPRCLGPPDFFQQYTLIKGTEINVQGLVITLKEVSRIETGLAYFTVYQSDALSTNTSSGRGAKSNKYIVTNKYV